MIDSLGDFTYETASDNTYFSLPTAAVLPSTLALLGLALVPLRRARRLR